MSVVQLWLDYPDLNYPDFTMIGACSTVPILIQILEIHYNSFPSDKALFECLGSVQHGWKEKNHVEAFQLMQPQRMMALVMHTCCSSLKQTDLCQHAR